MRNRLTILIILSQLLSPVVFANDNEPAYAYEFDATGNIFRELQHLKIQHNLAVMNAASTSQGKGKVYFASVYLGEIGNYTLAKESRHQTGEVEMTSASSRTEEEGLKSKLKLMVLRFKELIPVAERTNSIVYLVGYYTRRDKFSEKKQLYFLQELQAPAYSEENRAAFMTDLTRFKYYPRSSQAGLYDMQARRIERLGEMLFNGAKPFRELKLRYKIADTELQEPGGWLSQARQNVQDNSRRQTAIDLHKPSVMVAAFAPIFNSSQYDSALRQLTQLKNQCDAAGRTGLNFKLIVTDGYTKDEDFRAIEEFVSTAEGFVVVWLHLNVSSVTMQVINAVDIKNEICSEFIDNNADGWHAYLKTARKTVMIWPAMLEIVTWMGGKAEIPEHYIDPENANYNPVLADAYKFLSGITFPLEIMADGIKQLSGSPATIHTATRVEFAFIAGMWNSTRGVLLAFPDFAKMIRELYCDLQKREEFKLALVAFRKKAEEAGGYTNTVLAMVKDRYTKANPCMLSYYLGGHLVDIFTIYIAFLKTGQLARLSKLLDLVDPVFYFLEPLMKLAGFAARAAKDVIIKGVYILGNVSKGMLLRIGNKAGKHVFEVYNKAIGEYVSMLSYLQQSGRVVLTTVEGWKVNLFEFPQLEELIANFPNSPVTYIDRQGKRFKVVDISKIPAAADAPPIEELPVFNAINTGSKPNEIEDLDIVDADGGKLYAINKDGKQLTLIPGEGGKSGNGRNGGNDGNGNVGNDNANSNGGSGGPPRRLLQVRVKSKKVKPTGEAHFVLALSKEGTEVAEMTRQFSGGTVTYAFKDAADKTPTFQLKVYYNVDGSDLVDPIRVHVDLDLPLSLRDKYVNIETIMFEDAIAVLGKEAGGLNQIDAMVSHWKTFSSNHSSIQSYLESIANKMPEVEAVEVTPVGRLANLYGFKYTQILSGNLPNDVTIIFSKYPHLLEVLDGNRIALRDISTDNLVIPVHCGNVRAYNLRRNFRNGGFDFVVEMPHTSARSPSQRLKFYPSVDIANVNGKSIVTARIATPNAEFPGLESIVLENVSEMLKVWRRDIDVLEVIYSKSIYTDHTAGYQRFLKAGGKNDPKGAAWLTPEGIWAIRQKFPHVEVEETAERVILRFKKEEP
jgi:hypothetical protein